MFALGLQPTGSKDPFALRRAANGIVKIIAEHKLPLPVSKLFSDARAEYKGSEAEQRFSRDVNFEESIANFMCERLEFYLRDVRGFAYDVVNAVLAAGSDDVVDAIARAQAVSEVRGSEDFASISVAFKRIKNILRQARERGIEIPEQYDLKLLVEESELALQTAISEIGGEFLRHRLGGEYGPALAEMAKLRRPIDAFFDHVMVMTEDAGLRDNRLGFLQLLAMNYSTIADFSEIVTEGKTA
jgi:glycyl-tRNA synthetase beta chain